MRKILITLSFIALADTAPVLAKDCVDHQAEYEAGVSDGRMDGSRGASEDPARHREVSTKHKNRQACYEQGYRIGYGNAAADAKQPRASANHHSDAPSAEAPEGVVYCGGGAIKRQIEYSIRRNPAEKWDARVTVNGQTIRAMTAYSYFGNAAPPRGFVVALLGEDRSEFLVFRDGKEDWLEFGDYTYRKCN